MTRAERARMYADYLTEIGYVPTTHEGEVRFKIQGKTYQILIGEDEALFQLVCPRFWPIRPGSTDVYVNAAALKATGETKVVKVNPTSDQNVSAVVELFCVPPDSFKAWLARALSAIVLAVTVFEVEMEMAPR